MRFRSCLVDCVLCEAPLACCASRATLAVHCRHTWFATETIQMLPRASGAFRGLPSALQGFSIAFEDLPRCSKGLLRVFRDLPMPSKDFQGSSKISQVRPCISAGIPGRCKVTFPGPPRSPKAAPQGLPRVSTCLPSAFHGGPCHFRNTFQVFQTVVQVLPKTFRGRTHASNVVRNIANMPKGFQGLPPRTTSGGAPRAAPHQTLSSPLGRGHCAQLWASFRRIGISCIPGLEHWRLFTPAHAALRSGLFFRS